VLSFVSFICVVIICAIHAGVLLSAVSQTAFWGAFQSAATSVITIWIAIVALTVRAIEQGLQPEREIERYQQYRSAVQAILERFEHARSQGEQLKIMRDMERLAFDEMRNFLVTNARAWFVM
jgi:hypothetical protein